MPEGAGGREKGEQARELSVFLDGWGASLVILSGPAAGTEHALDQVRVTLGRGPGVDLAFDDPTMSREHAAVEFRGRGFRLRDMRSTNGTLLNGAEVEVAELKNGDRLTMGEQQLQFVLVEREARP